MLAMRERYQEMSRFVKTLPGCMARYLLAGNEAVCTRHVKASSLVPVEVSDVRRKIPPLAVLAHEHRRGGVANHPFLPGGALELFGCDEPQQGDVVIFYPVFHAANEQSCGQGAA